MAEYIELTEELKLSMRAGARAILNTKKYHGTIYMKDAFSDSPKEMPYLKAAEILYTASEKESEDVAPVVHGEWQMALIPVCGEYNFRCSACNESFFRGYSYPDVAHFCPNCGAMMDGDAHG